MTAPGPARLARFAPLLVSALCLSACAAAPPGADGRRDARAAGQRPLASLPAAAGRVVAVRRIPYSNGFGQEIVLDGPRAMSGENLITAEALTTAGTGLRGGGAEELKVGRPTDAGIAAEMDRALPGVAMRLAAAPERGEEGAIGYATGAAGRLSCVYAWQYLEPARPLTLIEGAAGAGALPVSVRVRLCREEPVAAVVAALRGLRVSRPDGSVEAAPPRPGDDALTAAIGSPPPAAAPDGTDADPGRPLGGPARAATGRRAHRVAAPRRRAAARMPVRRSRGPSPDPAGVPRVPMPGDVRGDAPVAAAPTRTAPLAAAGGDLPMPR